MEIEKGPTGRIKKLREVLAGITREDILGVLSNFSIDESAKHGLADSTDFDLVFDGKAFPPKAVLGLAAAREVGRPLTSDEFSGGESSPCFSILRELGFAIERKPVMSFRPRANRGLRRLQGYDREEIARLFEPGYEFKRGAGRWGISGIVESPKGSGDFVLMVTLGKPVEGNPYQDALTLDGHLFWQSQTQQDFESPAICKLLGHDPEANSIHLFLRAKEGAKYIYFGLLRYFSHDPNKANPVHIVWTIHSWELGQADLDQLGIPVRLPLDPAYSPRPPLTVSGDLRRVSPPTPASFASGGMTGTAGDKRKARTVDWAARDLRNLQLGLQGEKLVLRYEVSALRAAGRADLAAQVQHVALVDSAAGFDIASFHPDGRPKRIEVKTTQGPAATPFFISMNEVRASRDRAESFSIYRVFNLQPDSDHVSFFELPGDVELSCRLVPVSFRAIPGGPTQGDGCDARSR